MLAAPPEAGGYGYPPDAIGRMTFSQLVMFATSLDDLKRRKSNTVSTFREARAHYLAKKKAKDGKSTS